MSGRQTLSGAINLLTPSKLTVSVKNGSLLESPSSLKCAAAIRTQCARSNRALQEDHMAQGIICVPPRYTSKMSATFRSTAHYLIWVCISLAFVCLLAGMLCFRFVHVLSYWRCTVVNINDARLINERGDGARQNPKTIGLLQFRRKIAPLLKPGWKSVDTIAALRHWARTQQPSDRQLWNFQRDEDPGDVDPGILLKQQHALTPGACRR